MGITRLPKPNWQAGLTQGTDWDFHLPACVSLPSRALRMRFADDADTAVCPITRLRPDRDVDILAERGEQAHQTFAGEVSESSIEKRRYLWLVDAHEGRRCDLGQTPTLDRLPDEARKLRFCQLFLGIRKSQVGEYVAAARRHRDFGFSLFDHCS